MINVQQELNKKNELLKIEYDELIAHIKNNHKSYLNSEIEHIKKCATLIEEISILENQRQLNSNDQILTLTNSIHTLESRLAYLENKIAQLERNPQNREAVVKVECTEKRKKKRME